jgi:hypothetical protein
MLRTRDLSGHRQRVVGGFVVFGGRRAAIVALTMKWA